MGESAVRNELIIIVLAILIVLSSFVSAGETEAHGETMIDGGAASTTYGARITVKDQNIFLVNITRPNGATPTYVQVRDTNNANLTGNLTFTGDTAILPSNLELTAGTEYWIVANSAGSSYTVYHTQNTPFPIEGTSINWTQGIWDNEYSGDKNVGNIESIGISLSSGDITLLYPEDDNTYNSRLNFTAISGISADSCELWGNWSGIWAKNATNSSITADANMTFVVDLLPAGTYKWNINCSTAGDTNWAASNFTFTMDLTEPLITINSNNDFTSDNYTRNNPYDNTAQFNISVTDAEDLFGFQLLIEKGGTVYHNYTNESFSGLTSFNYYNGSVDISSWASGEYNVTIYASDSHTAKAIPDYMPRKYTDKLEYQTEDKTTITIEAPDAINSDTTKKNDRYDFQFEYSVADKTKLREYYVESDKPIHYLPDSGYRAHFVTGKNWIDFESSEVEAFLVEKINDYRYKVSIDFKTIKSKNIFSSIGGLNLNEKHYIFHKRNYTITAPTAYSSKTSNITLNISFDSTTMNSLNASLIYADTEYTPTKETHTDFIIFHKEISTANVATDTNYSFNWNISLSQKDGSLSDFLLNGTHLVNAVYIDNCSTATNDTANFYFYDLDSNPIDIDYEITLLYGYTASTQEFNYSNAGYSLNNFSLCIYPDSVNLYTDIILKYINGSQIFYYNTDDTKLNSTAKDYSLYVDGSASTQVLFSIIDYDNDPIAGAYLHILKYDLGTNTYKTVEILQTDEEGQTIGNIQTIDAFYKFLIYYDNALVFTYPESGGIRILSNTKTFRVDLGGTDNWFDDYDDVLGLTHSLDFNNATKTFSFSWSDPTGTSQKGCMKVIQRNNTKDRTISDTCETSASSAINQYIGTLTPEDCNDYIATGYFMFDGEIDVVETYTYETPCEPTFFKEDTTGITSFTSFMIVGALTMLGLPLPGVALTLMGVGLLFTFIIGMWNVSIGLIVGIIILIVLNIYKGSSK